MNNFINPVGSRLTVAATQRPLPSMPAIGPAKRASKRLRKPVGPAKLPSRKPSYGIRTKGVSSLRGIF